jgi:hypothetical protein
MPFSESAGFCPYCNRQVLIRKETPRNTFHLLMCIFTCGLWVFVWICANFLNLFAKYRCSVCGSQISSNYAQQKELQSSRAANENYMGLFSQINAPKADETAAAKAPTLINCPACAWRVSNQAVACPKCGQPLK